MKVGGGSYLSSHDPRVVLGIGERTKIDWLEVQWPLPSGAVERLTQLPLDRYITRRRRRKMELNFSNQQRHTLDVLRSIRESSAQFKYFAEPDSK
jgi:ASPIC and UnbV